VLSLIDHDVAMTDFGGGIPDHRHNKAVTNRISHGGPWRPLLPCRNANGYRRYRKKRRKDGSCGGAALKEEGLAAAL